MTMSSRDRYRSNRMYAALKVIIETPKVSAAVASVDPMALRQAYEAIRLYEGATQEERGE